MNINLLQSFVAVVNCKGLTKAARQLHLTQPAVTKHIQTLEEIFGVRLIDRAIDARPTAEGELLYRHAKIIIKTLEDVQEEIQKMSDTMQGKLTVGASTIPGQYLMPKILGLFKSQYPQTEIALEISDTERVVNKILDETILIGAIGARVRNPKLYLQDFFNDTLVFIASPSSSFVKKTQLTIEEASMLPFIWREKGSGTRKAAEELLKAAGYGPLEFNIIMELNSTEAIVTAVESGLGISLISKCAVERSLTNGSLITLEVKGLPLNRTLYIVTLRNNLKRKLVSTFIQAVNNFRDQESGNRGQI